MKGAVRRQPHGDGAQHDRGVGLLGERAQGLAQAAGLGGIVLQRGARQEGRDQAEDHPAADQTGPGRPQHDPPLVRRQRLEVEAPGGVAPKALDQLGDAIARDADRHRTDQPRAEWGVEQLRRPALGLAVVAGAAMP